MTTPADPCPIFVSTAIPYVNASPRIGFALELVLADAIARFHRQSGREIRFQTGTDDNQVPDLPQLAGHAFGSGRATGPARQKLARGHH